MGRKPKHDDFDDLDPYEERYSEYDDSENSSDEDENEEVDFDNPDFEKGEMWSDYAEDLDFEDN